jgi:superfamily II DNA/RNA helicase
MESTFEFACYALAVLFVLWLRYTPEKAQALVTEPIEQTEMSEETATEHIFSISDPWEESVTALPQARQWVFTVKPQPVKPVLALCPAKDEPKVEPVKPVVASTTQTDLNKLDAGKLRKLCTEYGIKWRNIHGKNRHASKTEMVSQLEALNLSIA